MVLNQLEDTAFKSINIGTKFFMQKALYQPRSACFTDARKILQYSALFINIGTLRINFECINYKLMNYTIKSFNKQQPE